MILIKEQFGFQIRKQGEPITGIEIIYSNKEIALVNKRISDLYASYYEFDSNNSSYNFNETKFCEDKLLLLGMLEQLKHILESINDGTFEIEDRISSLYDWQFFYF